MFLLLQALIDYFFEINKKTKKNASTLDYFKIANPPDPVNVANFCTYELVVCNKRFFGNKKKMHFLKMNPTL
jgi:hypothetical protein